jgi:F420-0:gamma-glutamyl ligase
MGTLDVAIGSSGICPRPNFFGHTDSFGKPKFGGMDIVAHELTCASALLFGQLTAAIPAVIVRGYEYAFDEKATIANTLWAAADMGKWRRLLKDAMRATACVKPLPTRWAMKALSWLM